MGRRYRKTFKAGPIRVTASKSGISYSAGVKGVRVTKRADGRVQTTVSAPSAGLSYTKTSGKAKKATSVSPTKAPRPVAAPKNRAAKPQMPTRKSLEQAWRASGKPLPAHGPRMSDRKVAFLAELVGIVANPEEEVRLFLAVSKLKPARDVLVVTSQRLLMFQANQVLRDGQIMAVDLRSLREVTVRRRPWSASLMLRGLDGTEEVCGTVSPKGLAWLSAAANDDPLFVLHN